MTRGILGDKGGMMEQVRERIRGSWREKEVKGGREREREREREGERGRERERQTGGGRGGGKNVPDSHAI